MDEIRPTGVTADRQKRRLTITWSDGHVGSFSYAGLRLACPCVECKGGHANMGRITPPGVVREAPDSGVLLEQLIPIGTYALQPRWSDGHDTGIYTWTLLRALDPPETEAA